jgi:tetratricopeptide (TPR) repeat protein
MDRRARSPAARRPDSALAPALRAAALDPMVPTRHRQVAITYTHLDDEPAAIQWHHWALQARPDFVLSRVDLFYLHLVAGRPEQAASYLRAARALNGGDVRVREAAAVWALDQGDPATAGQELASLLPAVSGSDRARVELKLADALLRQGRSAEGLQHVRAAEELLRELLDSGHECPRVRLELARAAALAGRRADTYTWLQAAVRAGLLDWRWLVYEPALAALRGEPRFETLVGELRTRTDRLRAATEAERLRAAR